MATWRRPVRFGSLFLLTWAELVELAARRRAQYHRYQPRFWQPADDASKKQSRFFHALVEDERVAVLVATDAAGEIRGFAVARIVDAPPVYAPGGPTCMVDDYTVSADSEWPEVGALLLEAVTHWAGSRGAAQLVVATAHLDEPKRRLLRSSELSLASEWWVGAVTRPDGDGSQLGADDRRHRDGDDHHDGGAEG